MFLVSGEGYIRLSKFGLEGLSFSRFKPASIAVLTEVFDRRKNSFTGLKPDSEFMLAGAPVRVNHEGFRDRDHARSKDPGVLRILLLGGSVSMGWGIHENERYPNLVEAALNERPRLESIGRKGVEIINLAFAANGYPDLISTLESVGLSYHPDLIMIELQERTRYYSSNLWHAVQNGVTTAIGPAERAKNVSFFLYYLSSLAHSFSQTKESYDVEFEGVTAGELEQVLGRIQQIARPVPLVFLLHASLDGSAEATEHHRRFRGDLRAVSARLGASIVELNHESDALHFDDLEIFPGDLHPNARGHRIFADHLLQGLLPILPHAR